MDSEDKDQIINKENTFDYDHNLNKYFIVKTIIKPSPDKSSQKLYENMLMR